MFWARVQRSGEREDEMHRISHERIGVGKSRANVVLDQHD